MKRATNIPLYLQLMEQLITKINNGDYAERDKLPSERELCEIYDLSRTTVRQALQELEREGYIYKEHGKGTFVAPKSFNQHLVHLYSFTDEMDRAGKKPTTKVLSFEKIAIDERLAKNMDLNVYDEVFKVSRLRLADEEPLMYEISYLPSNVFSKLTEEALMKKPMYKVFSEDYGVAVTRATEQFSATRIRSSEAVHLQTSENQPAMLIKRHAYDRNILIEYTISVARGDKFKYTVELS